MTSRSLAVLGVAVLFAACSDSTTAPGAGGNTGGGGGGGGGGTLPTQFAQTITLPELDSLLGDGPARVEIKLVNGSLVAREVEVKESQDMASREKVESRITAIDPAGNVTLALGGLVVDFDGATELEAENGQHLTMAEFTTRIMDALAAGTNPAVEAKRSPAAMPQDPDDATFLATRIELNDEADEDKIEINVDSDNFANTMTPPPDAILTVLNLPIELDVTGGVTTIESEVDDDTPEAEFDGLVDSVSGSSFTLADGTVVDIVDDTEIDQGDDSDELSSLAEVEQALAAGLLVEAEGAGVVTGSNPLTIAASEVEFEIEDNEDDLPGAVEFDDRVSSVDLPGRSLTLANGKIVQVADDSLIDPSGDLLTLQAADSAVQAGRKVKAEGGADLVDAGPPMVLNALGIKIEDDD